MTGPVGESEEVCRSLTFNLTRCLTLKGGRRIPVASRIPPRAGVKTTSDKEERFSQKGDGEEAVHERRGSTKEAQYIMMSTEKKPPDMRNDLYKTRRRTRIDRIRI